MTNFRLFLSLALVVYMTGAGRYVYAQEDTSPFSLTLDPGQYAQVKGNVSEFQALNWMPAGANPGVSDITFVKDINKDISLNVEGSEFPKSDTGNGHLTLKDGDLAFLQIDYNAFRRYYDDNGGVFTDPYPGTTWKIPGSAQGAVANSPDLQMDVSFFKLEAGLGPISDPFLDVTYEHNTKDGDKSYEEWGNAYYYSGSTLESKYRLIGPSWESVDDSTDTVTFKEKKEFAGITIKAEQDAEIDYNHNTIYSQYLSNSATGANSQVDSENESPDAKLFGAGVRAEKWMLNDNTYAAIGYHYNHIHDTDLMLNQVSYPETVSGLITLVPQATTSASLWNFSRSLEDDHVLVGNINTNLTPNLTFLADTRYEHMGSEGDAVYYQDSSTSLSAASSVQNTFMENHDDQEGEHVELEYSGIAHTSLYAESNLEQERNWTDETYASTSSGDFTLEQIARTQQESWDVGGRIVPNRFFTLTTEVKQHAVDNQYDTVHYILSTSDILMDALKENGVDETSTLTWRPYHWLQNSLKYQFDDTVYNPQLAAEGTGVPGYDITSNHMLTSQFTYDISVQPIDPLLLMFTYSHAENYVRTVGASSLGGEYIPDFSSGDNSFLFSSSYSPLENLSWTNSVCYTIAPNYVNFGTGLPLGSDFRETSFTTGIDWTYHKWLKIGPAYEYSSYKVDPLTGVGNFSANIYKINIKFSW